MASQQPARLIITKLRLENFKSYYGVQEVGIFHQCFSAVVGPNGSGKSNVIDAMLFVFGKRAKQIRQDKLADLIHKSEKHRDLDDCSVTVFFQDIIDLGNDQYSVVPGSELTVKRQAFRNNTSLFYVNDEKKTFKEVGILLRERGIDLDHNRFLILQGEVEQIAMMKPKAQTDSDEGLLEYLEDIIGSNKYKTDIATAAEKEEQLNEQRAEKLNRVKLVEKEKDSLESGKREAEQYLITQNELTRQRSRVFQVSLHQARIKLESVCATHTKAKETHTKAKADLNEELERAKQMEKIHAKELKEFTQLQSTVEKAKSDFATFERKDIQLRENLKHATRKEKTFNDSMQKAQAQLGEQQAAIAAAENEIAKAEEAIAQKQVQLKKEEQALDAIRDELKGEIAAFQPQLDAKQRELEPHSKRLNEAQAAFDLTKAELELLTSNARKHFALLEDTRAGLVKAKQIAESRTLEGKQLRAQRIEVDGQLKQCKQQLASMGNEEVQLADRVRVTMTKLEEAKSSTQTANNRSQVIDVLTKQCKAGKVKGVFGRLGDLGTIDEKFDCAVTTACGALNNIVVDTTATAQWCVEFLRHNNVGRATFVILEKVAYLQSQLSQPFAAPENVPRLFDLVKPKEAKFAAAFYFALRDTLVAGNLEQATRIAYHGSSRNRVVTLEGQLIDSSGTMSGGGTKVARGGMSSKIVEEFSMAEVAAMESALNSDNSKLCTFRADKRQLEIQVEKLTQQLQSIETQIEKCQMDVEAMHKQEVQLSKQLQELEAKNPVASIDQGKQQQLEAALARDQAALAKIQAVVSRYEQEIKEIEQKILDVGGPRQRAQKQRVDTLAEKISSLQDDITKRKVDAKTTQRAMDKAQKKLQKDGEERIANKDSIEQIQAELQSMEKDAETVLQGFKQASAVLEAKEGEMKTLKVQHDEVKQKVSKLQNLEVDAEHQLEEQTRQLTDAQTRTKQWEKKLSTLELFKIESPLDDDEEEASAEAKQQQEQLVMYTAEELQALDVEHINNEIAVLEEQVAQMKPNLAAIREYNKKEEEYLGRVAELDAITQQRDQIRADYDRLRKLRLDTFMEGFNIITLKLKEMYRMITLGGDAELELVDNLNPFSEGIVFSVRPHKKSWKNISNLSGGEKTLSSLALVFALHHYKPTPLYVMDEIDAALDFRNVSIVGNYIKERTKNAQFIIISLRNNMFELADRLVGIYKTDYCTKSVTINPSLVAAAAAQMTQEASSASASSKGDVRQSAPALSIVN